MTVTVNPSASSAGANGASSTGNPLLKNGVAGRMEIARTLLVGAGLLSMVLLRL